MVNVERSPMASLWRLFPTTAFCRNINLRGPMTITKYIVARTAEEASRFWILHYDHSFTLLDV